MQRWQLRCLAGNRNPQTYRCGCLLEIAKWRCCRNRSNCIREHQFISSRFLRSSLVIYDYALHGLQMQIYCIYIYSSSSCRSTVDG